MLSQLRGGAAIWTLSGQNLVAKMMSPKFTVHPASSPLQRLLDFVAVSLSI